jgi:hypothetical protein
MSDSVTETARRRRLDVPAIAGMIFFATFIAAWIAVVEPPDSDAPVAEWNDWLNDGWEASVGLISAVLLIVAAMAFIVFVSGVARQITRLGDEDNFAAEIVKGFGVLAAALFVASGIVINTAPIVHLFDDSVPDLIDVQMILQLQSLGLGIALFGAAFATCGVIAVTSYTLRSVTPRWYTIVGYAAAVIGLASFLFIPMAVFPIWVLIGAIMSVRTATPV